MNRSSLKNTVMKARPLMENFIILILVALGGIFIGSAYGEWKSERVANARVNEMRVAYQSAADVRLEQMKICRAQTMQAMDKAVGAVETANDAVQQSADTAKKIDRVLENSGTTP